MAIDPSIPLSARPPQTSPMQTLGQVYALKNAQMDLQRKQKQNERLDVEDKVAMRKVAGDAVVAKALSMFPNDPDKAADFVSTQGYGDNAMDLRGKILEHRKSQLEQGRQQADSIAAAHAVQLGLLNSITDPQSYAMVRGIAKSLVKDPQGQQQFDETFPEMYDQKLIDQHKRALMTYQEQHQSDQDALSAQSKAYDEGLPDKDGKYSPKSIEFYRGAAANWLSKAKTQDDWDKQMQALRHQGYPASVLEEFGPTLAPKKAKEFAFTAEQLETNALRKRQEDRLDNAEKQDPTYTRDRQDYRDLVSIYDKTQPKEGDLNPDADPKSGDSTFHYTPPISFEQWRKAGKPDDPKKMGAVTPNDQEFEGDQAPPDLASQAGAVESGMTSDSEPVAAGDVEIPPQAAAGAAEPKRLELPPIPKSAPKGFGVGAKVRVNGKLIVVKAWDKNGNITDYDEVTEQKKK